jgi:hypothetical protein
MALPPERGLVNLARPATIELLHTLAAPEPRSSCDHVSFTVIRSRFAAHQPGGFYACPDQLGRQLTRARLRLANYNQSGSDSVS